MAQCWAYGPRGRCEQHAGHEGGHQLIFIWSDDECIDPTQAAPAPRQEPAHLAQPATSVASSEEGAQVVAGVPVPQIGEVNPADLAIGQSGRVSTPGPCVICNHHHKGGSCGRPGCECQTYAG